MKIFQKYADYYDLFYREKNYQTECDFLEKIFRKYSKKPICSVLDLGCGTGGHALILGERGYEVTGIDLSSEMIKIAKRKAREKKIKVDFIQSDIRNLNLWKKFDATISMFAVISYLTSEKDLTATFKRVSNHFKSGGLFIFDCWFGPAVLKQKPEKRIKIFQQQNEKIFRIAIPYLNLKKQTAKIEFRIIRALNDKVLEDFKEIHKMRYFFLKEIKRYLREANLELIKICPFMKLGKIPTKQDWNVIVIAKKYD